MSVYLCRECGLLTTFLQKKVIDVGAKIKKQNYDSTVCTLTSPSGVRERERLNPHHRIALASCVP